MGYITADTFEDAYDKIKSGTYWKTCTVLILVAPDVDALCASKILVSLFRADDVIHQIKPISGYTDMEKTNELYIKDNNDLRSVILINCGALIDLTEFFTPSDLVTLYLIDSRRPWNLDNVFGSPQIVVFDDGDIKEDMQGIRQAYEALEFGGDQDNASSDEDSQLESSDGTRKRTSSSRHRHEDDMDDDFDDDDIHDDDHNERLTEDNDDDDADDRVYDSESSEQPTRRRRTESPEGSVLSIPVLSSRQTRRKNKKALRENRRKIAEYYAQGTFFGQSAAGQVYVLASKLERVDHDMLWLAIVSLTSQHISQVIDDTRYEISLQLYKDDVARLNTGDSQQKNPDTIYIKCENELRFMLYRHWSIYESMYHTGYVASRLRLWGGKGRSKLQGLFAKMGIPLQQAQQNYTHMDRALKRILPSKIDSIAPEYGMNESTFSSFTKSFGYRSVVSASDIVYGVTALLEATPEVARRLGIGVDWTGGEVNKENQSDEAPDNGQDVALKASSSDEWWYTNFFTASDALDDIYLLESSLPLAMRLQQAILRQCASMLDKAPIKKMANFRLAIIDDGPDLALFANALTLNKLGLFMCEVLQEIANKQLPLVIAALDVTGNRYLVIGISVNNGRRGNNRFALAFQETAQRSKARIQMDSFNSSVMEIEKEDLVRFVEMLHFSL